MSSAKRLALSVLLLLSVVTTAVWAQSPLDFAQKFVSSCKNDSALHCVTVSPKMMEQMLKQEVEGRNEMVMRAISKLKSARIVTAPAAYYQQAEALLKKNARRFKHERDYTTETTRGAFYSRKNKKGKTEELIMLHEQLVADKVTIVCLTGDLDEEFLCFLYNKD